MLFQNILGSVRKVTFSRYSENNIISVTAGSTISLYNVSLSTSHQWTINNLSVNITSSNLNFVSIAMRKISKTAATTLTAVVMPKQSVENLVLRIHNSTFSRLDLQSGTKALITDCHLDGQLKVNKILISVNNSVLDIKRSTFRRHVCEEGPTVIHAHSNSQVFIENTTFHGQLGVHGAICVYTGSTLSLMKTNFVDNIAYDNTYSTLTLWTNASAIINNSVFENNLAYIGGAIWAGTGCNIRCYGSQFNDNRAVDGGGIRIKDGTTLVLSNSTMIRNEAIPGHSVSSKMIAAEGTTFSLMLRQAQGLISNMNADSVGGSVAATANCVVIMEASEFYGNKAAKVGGVLAAGSNTSVTVQECRFNGNSALKFSGALNVFNQSLLSVLDSSFENNTVFVPGTINIFGAAISLVRNSKGSIENSRFFGNKGWQGIVYTEDNVQLNITRW